MKTFDPNQLHVFNDADAPPFRVPVQQSSNEYVRVRDKLDAAAANNQSLIRLQPGYGGSPWIIKQQTKNGAGGWRHLKQYETGQEAKDAYALLLNSGEYVEG